MSNLTAAVLLIGNELLSGRTQDVNLRVLATMLCDMGISLVETRVIKDVEDHIIAAVRELSGKYTYVFTTGGIGGTHDDITAACVAKAFNRRLEVNPEALAILENYYEDRLNPARSRMALIPSGSELIANPISAAPGFRLENTFILPGFPSIMQAMLEYVRPMLEKGVPILYKSVTCDLGEGVIADGLADIQNRHPTIEIGSYPFFREGKIGVNLVLRGLDEGKVSLAVDEVTSLVESLGAVPVLD